MFRHTNPPSVMSLARRFCSLKLKNVESAPHTPVMSTEIVSLMKPQPGQLIVDMTFGAGGHSKSLLETCPHIRLFGLDRDPQAIKHAEDLQETYPENFTPLRGKFSDLPMLLHSHGVRQGTVDGFLFDLGCSSMQFDQAERGFALSKDGPLDMRMDQESGEPTAADVLATLQEHELAKIFTVYGEERQAKKIARAIVQARSNGHKLCTTQQLSELVSTACNSDHRQDKLQRHAHSATKVFQALRIFVNDELNEINYAMILAYHYLKVSGRMATLAFHSLEDTIIKRHISGNVIENVANPVALKYFDASKVYGADEMSTLSESGWRQLNKHVIIPRDEEVAVNPRSRSAKLRVALKVN